MRITNDPQPERASAICEHKEPIAFQPRVKRAVLLNGPSSSGKSTLARAIQARMAADGERFDIVSIDDFLPMSPDRPLYEDDVFAVSGALCDAVRRALAAGGNVVVDHVITSERIFRQLSDAVSECAPDALALVRVTCALPELRRREALRGDRPAGSVEASERFLYPTDGYDLTVDTSREAADACAATVAALLSQARNIRQEVRAMPERSEPCTEAARALPVLRTDRLTLDALRADDAPAMCAGWMNSENALRYTFLTAGMTVPEGEAFIARLAARRAADAGFHQWAIRENGALVGTIGLYAEPDGRQARVMYLLAEGAWGRGIATEALRAVLAFAFGTLGVLRVEGDCFAENAASARVMEKAGMRREGVERGAFQKDGAQHDKVLFGMTAGA